MTGPASGGFRPSPRPSPASTGEGGAIPRTEARYRDQGRFARHYVAAKLRHDPVHADLLALARAEGGLGAVLDLGCGRGQLGVLLLEAGAAARVAGLDWNAAHLAIAARAARGLAFRAEQRDLSRAGALPDADTVLLVDVLYQLDTAAQAALLDAATLAARRLVVIRTADPGRGWRSVVTRWAERAGRRVWPHAGATVNARPLEALRSPLERAGLRVDVAPCWRGTPFANVLLVARRR